MTAAIDVVLPIFGLILCGYGAVLLRIMGAEGVKGLSHFVFFFTIPALLFRGIVNTKPAAHDQFAIVYAYFAGRQ